MESNICVIPSAWICSYFLIGFYIERKTATNAGNKAFIVNRVGDFGMIIGLMALWGSLGTFNFGDLARVESDGSVTREAGIFSQVRPAAAGHALVVPDGMVLAGAFDELKEKRGQLIHRGQLDEWREGEPGRRGSNSILQRWNGRFSTL